MRVVGESRHVVKGGYLGAMRERVTLQSQTRTKGSGGFATDTPTDVVTDVPAEFLPDAGAEPFEASAQRGQVMATVRIRYRTDVRASWLVVRGAETWQVLEAPVNHDGRRRYLWLRCGLVES